MTGPATPPEITADALPSAAALRAYMRATGWREQEPGGPAGSIWTNGTSRIGVPYDDDTLLVPGVINRLAEAEGRAAADVTQDILAAKAPGDPAHEALAASLPEEWVRAAESWYSMHGSGLVRNLLAGAAPLIAAAERERAEAAEAKLAELQREHDKHWHALWVLVRQFGGSIFLAEGQLSEVPPLATLAVCKEPGGLRINAEEEP